MAPNKPYFKVCDQWLSRVALAIIFVWFGMLKVVGMSPAMDLVNELMKIVLPGVSPSQFLIFLGLLEVVIGLLFLFPKITKIAFWVMLVHMFTTFGPLVFVPNLTWKIFLLVPTMEGQYILKNLALVALGYAIYNSHVQGEKLNK